MSKQVRTTKTYVDEGLKLRDIKLKINEHKSAEEVAKRSLDNTVLALEDLNKRKNEIEELISIRHTDSAKFVETVNRVINESIISMKAATVISDGLLLLVKKLEDRIEEQKKELDIVEQKKKEAFSLISSEETRLSIVKSDLEIYRIRLQKKIDAYGLSDEIKVII